MLWNNKDYLTSLIHSEKGVVHVIVTILLFLVVAGAGALGYFVYHQHETKLVKLSADLQNLEMRMINVERVTDTLGKKVNLTNPGVQKIDTVFLISKIKVERYLTGVKIRGIMINSSSLEHNDARFRITVATVSREFSIRKISPGSSRKFVVEVPDVPVEKAVEADIKNLASSVSYFVD